MSQPSEPTADALAGDEKPCSTCAKMMPATGLKCTECDSYQDWRRLFSVTSPILALAVALVSVLTFALPIWKDAITPKDSAIQISAKPDFTQDGVTVLINNSGIRPGYVRGAELAFWHGEDAVISLLMEGSAGGVIVEPGKSVPLTFIPVETRLAQPKSLLELLRKSPPDRCSYRIWGDEFSGRLVEKEGEIGCRSVGLLTMSVHYLEGTEFSLKCHDVEGLLMGIPERNLPMENCADIGLPMVPVEQKRKD